MNFFVEHPDSVLIAQVIGSRVEYFPFSLLAGMNLPDQPYSFDISSYDELQQILLRELAGKIKMDFASPIRLRGTVLNISQLPLDAYIELFDGTNPKISIVKTITQVLNDGLERNRDYTLTTRIIENDDEIPDMSREWAFRAPYMLRGYCPEQESLLFPAIIIYDNDMFKIGRNDLPKSPEDRRNAILHIYLLDYVYQDKLQVWPSEKYYLRTKEILRGSK